MYIALILYRKCFCRKLPKNKGSLCFYNRYLTDLHFYAFLAGNPKLGKGPNQLSAFLAFLTTFYLLCSKWHAKKVVNGSK